MASGEEFMENVTDKPSCPVVVQPSGLSGTGGGEMPLDEWERGNWKHPVTGREGVVCGGKTMTKMETSVCRRRLYQEEHGSGSRNACNITQRKRR